MTTGLNSATFENIQLNAGMFLKNFDYSSADSSTALQALLASALDDSERIIGATRGGGTFQATPALRSIEADGLRGPIAGGVVNDGWTVKLTGTMLEITPANFAAALCGADIESNGNITTLRARAAMSEADFIPSLCWVGDTTRGHVLIELTNALNVKGAAFTFTDKGEGTLPFEFQAHHLLGDDESVAPFKIVFFD